jgi:hypothetical protein
MYYLSKGSKDTDMANGKESEPHHFDAAPAPGTNNNAV